MVDGKAPMAEQGDPNVADLKERRPLQIANAPIVQVDDEPGRDGGDLACDGHRLAKDVINLAAERERQPRADAGRTRGIKRFEIDHRDERQGVARLIEQGLQHAGIIARRAAVHGIARVGENDESGFRGDRTTYSLARRDALRRPELFAQLPSQVGHLFRKLPGQRRIVVCMHDDRPASLGDVEPRLHRIGRDVQHAVALF